MLPHPIHLPLGLPLHFVVESATLYMPWASIGYYPPIWAQTNEPGLARKLRWAGFVPTGTFTKDELEILEFNKPLRIN
jgi:hypothetical protein